MKKIKYTFDISRFTSLEAYYIQEFMFKAMNGIKQYKADVLDFIETITTQTIDSLFAGNTAVVMKFGNNLVRATKEDLEKLVLPKDEPKQESTANESTTYDTEVKKPVMQHTKKPGFFKRIWKKIFG
jgi:hypothetical protein